MYRNGQSNQHGHNNQHGQTHQHGHPNPTVIVTNPIPIPVYNNPNQHYHQHQGGVGPRYHPGFYQPQQQQHPTAPLSHNQCNGPTGGF